MIVVMRRDCPHAAARARPHYNVCRDWRRRRRAGRHSRCAATAASRGAPPKGLGASAGAGPHRYSFAIGFGLGRCGRGRVIVYLALVFRPRLMARGGNAGQWAGVWVSD